MIHIWKDRAAVHYLLILVDFLLINAPLQILTIEVWHSIAVVSNKILW